MTQKDIIHFIASNFHNLITRADVCKWMLQNVGSRKQRESQRQAMSLLLDCQAIMNDHELKELEDGSSA